MATGRNRKSPALIAALLLCLAGAAQGEGHNSGIWKVMRAGGFSGPMDGRGHVRPIRGEIAAKGMRYKFWEYSWLNKETGHGGNALLVFDRTGKSLSYLGYYEYEGDDFRGPVHPQIRGTTVFFPYHDIEILGVKLSMSISFENGPPPEAVPGSVHKFER